MGKFGKNQVRVCNLAPLTFSYIKNMFWDNLESGAARRLVIFPASTASGRRHVPNVHMYTLLHMSVPACVCVFRYQFCTMYSLQPSVAVFQPRGQCTHFNSFCVRTRCTGAHFRRFPVAIRWRFSRKPNKNIVYGPPLRCEKLAG